MTHPRTALRPQLLRRHARGVAAAAATAALLATGCTVLTSELPSALERDGRAPSGVHYFLPMSVMDLTLSVDAERAQFRVTTGALRSIPDRNHRYYLRYKPLPQFHDHIIVDLNPKGFLKKITSTTIDKTNEIVENLAQAIGYGLEAAPYPTNESQLAKLSVDPTNHDRLGEAAVTFSKAVRDFSRSRLPGDCKKDDQGLILDPTKLALCREYTRLASMHSPVRLAVDRVEFHDENGTYRTHRVDHRHAAPRVDRVTTAPVVADCTVGVCYRPPIPYELKLAVGQNVVRRVILAPNAAELIEIDVRRALLVTKVQSIDFNVASGHLETIDVDKPSELLALSQLPLTVIKGLTDGLALRVAFLDERIKETNATKDLIDQRAALQKQRALLEAAVAYRAGQGGLANSASSLSSVPTGAGRSSSTQAAPASGKSFLDRERPVE